MYNIKLSEIMTPNPITVRPMDTMDGVKKIFDTKNIHHIIVVDENNTVLGIIGKENLALLSHHMTIFNRQKEAKFNDYHLKTIYAKEAMTKHVATLHDTDTIGVAVGIFRENLFHALPILNNEQKLVGILTTYDLLNFAFKEPTL